MAAISLLQHIPSYSSHLTKTKTSNTKLTILFRKNRKFSGDESFLKDPNAFNDAINTQAKEGEGTLKKGFRL